MCAHTRLEAEVRISLNHFSAFFTDPWFLHHALAHLRLSSRDCVHQFSWKRRRPLYPSLALPLRSPPSPSHLHHVVSLGNSFKCSLIYTLSSQRRFFRSPSTPCLPRCPRHPRTHGAQVLTTQVSQSFVPQVDTFLGCDLVGPVCKYEPNGAGRATAAHMDMEYVFPRDDK